MASWLLKLSTVSALNVFLALCLKYTNWLFTKSSNFKGRHFSLLNCNKNEFVFRSRFKTVYFFHL